MSKRKLGQGPLGGKTGLKPTGQTTLLTDLTGAMGAINVVRTPI